jgi:hypothetical protein
MAFNVNNYKTNGLVLGGARATLFDVTLAFPSDINIGNISQKITMTCEGAELPAASIGTVEIPYFGRKIKSAGDRTFTDWTITIQNDEDFGPRSAFEAWNNNINSLVGNLRDSNYLSEASATGSTASSYKVNMSITQYSKAGGILRSYIMTGAWPADVGLIRVNWNDTNRYETFDVRFAYDWWDIAPASNGTPATTVPLDSGA